MSVGQNFGIRLSRGGGQNVKAPSAEYVPIISVASTFDEVLFRYSDCKVPVTTKFKHLLDI